MGIAVFQARNALEFPPEIRGNRQRIVRKKRIKRFLPEKILKVMNVCTKLLLSLLLASTVPIIIISAVLYIPRSILKCNT
jgi:hypothetical protein